MITDHEKPQMPLRAFTLRSGLRKGDRSIFVIITHGVLLHTRMMKIYRLYVTVILSVREESTPG